MKTVFTAIFILLITSLSAQTVGSKSTGQIFTSQIIKWDTLTKEQLMKSERLLVSPLLDSNGNVIKTYEIISFCFYAPASKGEMMFEIMGNSMAPIQETISKLKPGDKIIFYSIKAAYISSKGKKGWIHLSDLNSVIQ